MSVPRATAGRAGFFGKIPSRGDFVRSGLPVGFVAAWDRWVASALVASRAILGPAWRPAWLEAPVWRFALPGGIAGPEAMVGVMMPSVDRAGRFFPLCLARSLADAKARELAARSVAFLAAAEAAGRAALAEDLSPEALAAHLARPLPDSGEALHLPPDLEGDLGDIPAHHGIWWTEGSPRVRAGGFALGALPGPGRFAAMLDERATAGAHG